MGQEQSSKLSRNAKHFVNSNRRAILCAGFIHGIEMVRWQVSDHGIHAFRFAKLGISFIRFVCAFGTFD
jgi:hypothetical protein